MAHTYQVNAKFAKTYPDAVTLIDGVPVFLSGVDREVETVGTAIHPPKKRKIRVATQNDLQYLFETENHPHIEKLPVIAGK